MKSSTYAALLSAIAVGTFAASLLLINRPPVQVAMVTCPAAQGGCYFPPPSIGRLMP
jgi:hypothetical protein